MIRCVVAALVACLAISMSARAQEWRFDFASRAPAHGFQAVAATTTFDASTGFGFEPGAAPHGNAPFLFSVAVPEGDYRVTVTLGDARGASDTTVRAESRRLML